MENKKFKLIREDYVEVPGGKIYRVVALVDFYDVRSFTTRKKGDTIGYYASEDILEEEILKNTLKEISNV